MTGKSLVTPNSFQERPPESKLFDLESVTNQILEAMQIEQLPPTVIAVFDNNGTGLYSKEYESLRESMIQARQFKPIGLLRFGVDGPKFMKSQIDIIARGETSRGEMTTEKEEEYASIKFAWDRVEQIFVNPNTGADDYLCVFIQSPSITNAQADFISRAKEIGIPLEKICILNPASESNQLEYHHGLDLNACKETLLSIIASFISCDLDFVERAISEVLGDHANNNSLRSILKRDLRPALVISTGRGKLRASLDGRFSDFSNVMHHRIQLASSPQEVKIIVKHLLEQSLQDEERLPEFMMEDVLTLAAVDDEESMVSQDLLQKALDSLRYCVAVARGEEIPEEWADKGSVESFLRRLAQRIPRNEKSAVWMHDVYEIVGYDLKQLG